jgi:hypothetical protein
MDNIKIKNCFNILQKYNLWNDDKKILIKNIIKNSVKYHPDKGGDPEIFKSIFDCKDFLNTDFEYFKQVIYGTSQSDLDSQSDSDSDYDPDESTKKTKNKKTQKKKQKEHSNINKEKFNSKECNAWLLKELIQFCKLININSKGTKKVLCNRLNDYFNPPYDKATDEDKPEPENTDEDLPETTENKTRTTDENKPVLDKKIYEDEKKRRSEFDNYISELIKTENEKRKVFDERYTEILGNVFKNMKI